MKRVISTDAAPTAVGAASQATADADVLPGGEGGEIEGVAST